MIDISQDSTVTLRTLVYDPDGLDDISRVEVYLNGIPTGILLLDDGTQPDDTPDDGYFIKVFDVPANSRSEGLLLVQVIAFDRAGNISNVFPYIMVEP